MGKNLSTETKNFVSRRKKIKEDEQNLFLKIKKLFDPELTKLKARMPQGYQLKSYEIMYDPDNVPCVMLDEPFKEGSQERLALEEMTMLNERLGNEFERIKTEYGFEIQPFGFMEYLV